MQFKNSVKGFIWNLLYNFFIFNEQTPVYSGQHVSAIGSLKFDCLCFGPIRQFCIAMHSRCSAGGHLKAARPWSGMLRGCYGDSSATTLILISHQGKDIGHVEADKFSTQVCTARDRKIQMSQICWRVFGGDASPLPRDASRKTKHLGKFGEASPNIRRCIADHFPDKPSGVIAKEITL